MKRGYTLIEIMLAISLIAVLGGAIIIKMNPYGMIAGARNSQRNLHLQALMNAVRQNIAESGNDTFTCAAGIIPATATLMQSQGGYDIAPCLVPTYMTAMPFDPKAANARYVSNTDYATGYAIRRSTSTGQVTITAPSAERGVTISLIR